MVCVRTGEFVRTWTQALELWFDTIARFKNYTDNK